MQRRRFIKIAASAAGLSLSPRLLRAEKLQPVHWQGYTLGAEGQFTLYTSNPAQAQQILQDCFTEIRRLEKIFSLYQADSELSRLNRDSGLQSAAPELIEVLSAVDEAHKLTKGLFDPTVQALWKLYATHFQNFPQSREGPAEDQIQSALRQTGWHKIEVNGREIRFRDPEVSLSLNGIAQGYITDRITHLLKTAGFTHALVELGETFGLGPHPEQRPWHIGIQSPDRKGIQEVVSLENQALATSGRYGSTFSADGRFHHLIHPKTGRPGDRWQSLSVIAPTATLADALSTGLSFATEAQIAALESSRADLKVIRS